MKNYRDYVQKDPYCKVLFLVFLITIVFELFSGYVLGFMRPISNLAFLVLGCRMLRDPKLEKTDKAKRVIWILIIGYGIYFVWNTAQLLFI